MEIADVFVNMRHKMKQLSYSYGQGSKDFEEIQIAFRDTISDYKLQDNELYALYEREMYSVENVLSAKVAFELRVTTKEGVSQDAMLAVIAENPDDFLRELPAEASLAIAMLLKQGGYPATLSSPLFLSDDD